MDTTGFIIGVELARSEATSARPDAPVVPDKRRRPDRPPRTEALRRTAALSLRTVAAWVEPTDNCAAC